MISWDLRSRLGPPEARPGHILRVRVGSPARKSCCWMEAAVAAPPWGRGSLMGYSGQAGASPNATHTSGRGDWHCSMPFWGH